MIFSELRGLTLDTGLEWDENGLCLYGKILDYPVFITDLCGSREYLLTVFCKTRAELDGKFTEEINKLLDNMPKNCVNGRRNELNFQQLKLNAVFFYQENSVLLCELAQKICEAADSLDFLPTAPDKALAVPPKQEAQKTAKAVRKPKNAVSKGFDKYSVRGLIGAVIGGAAMAVISSTMADNNPENIGAMLSSWAAGALIALVTLADYSFLAKKIDIFGTIVCSLVTVLSCFFCSVFGILRIMTNTVKTLDPTVTFLDSAQNWTVYAQLFPNVPGYFTSIILKNLFMALAASVIFYTLYYRKHQNIMYGDRKEVLERGDKK
ncbi:MAG: hypothetical protein HDT24_10800 [Ruminococcus sp.]|nr:hypothetical protein [Ruminococcus sp.]